MPGVLFIQQDPWNPPGLLAERFAHRSWGVTLFHADSGPFPDPLSFDAVVALGSDWSVNDPAIQAWLVPELRLLGTAHRNGIPVLGICFGSQALAVALGGSAGPARTPEIGWHLLRADGPLIEPGPWFQWHYDRWYPPPSGRILARTGVAPQAFQVGMSLGVQFHPEVSVPLVQAWLDHGGGEEITRLGMDAGDLIRQTREHEAGGAARCDRLVDIFARSRDRCLVRPYATYS